MTEHPLSEDAALVILELLSEIYPNAMREELICERIADHDGWEREDVIDGLTFAEQHSWTKVVRGRVSATKCGLEALARQENSCDGH